MSFKGWLPWGPSKDVIFCAQNIWICRLRLWSISLNGEAQFCCLYPRPDGWGKDGRSTNKSTDSAPSSPQQITTLIYLLLKYTTYTFVVMDPKNVTFMNWSSRVQTKVWPHGCPIGRINWLQVLSWAVHRLQNTDCPSGQVAVFFSSLRTKPSETQGLAGCWTDGGADHLDPHVHCNRLTD